MAAQTHHQFHKTICFSLSLLDPGPSKASDPLEFYSTCSCILSGLSSGILFPYVLVLCLANLLSRILSCISSGTLFDNLCGISSGIRSGISSGISSDILSGIVFGKSSGILSGKHSELYLAYLVAFYLAYQNSF